MKNSEEPLWQGQILLVEDDRETATVMRRVLTNWKYAVIHVETVAEAIAALDSHWFGLVACDIGLPDGNGRQVMQHAVKNFGLAGIAITAYGRGEDIALNEAAGFSTTLVKPASLDDIEAAIKRYLIPPTDAGRAFRLARVENSAAA